MSLRVSTSSWLKRACSGLMYSNVPTIWPYWVNIVRSVSRWAVALATPKSMIFGDGLAVVFGHQHVRGFEVAVDDAFLMGVLDGLADVRP